MYLYIDNQNIVELSELRDIIDLGAIEDATVTVTIKDTMTESPIDGQAWPTEMIHTENGTYLAVLSPDLEIKPNNQYLAVIDATTTGNVKGHWELRVTAKVRR